MRKLVVSLVILVVVAGVVFFFGWVQIQLPAGTFGVVFTKTNGWDDRVVDPGTFDWRWQRLLPTNFHLYRFSLEQRRIEVQSKGNLPSAELYSQYLEGTPSLAYDIDLVISYSLKPSALPQLARTGTTTQAELAAWYSDFESSVSTEAGTELTSIVNDLADETDGTVFSTPQVQTRLLKGLSDAFSDVSLASISVQRFSVPDLALYARARRMYFAVLDSKQQAIQQAVNSAARNQVDRTNQLDLLRQYGQLLTEYPVLLKYLALEQGKDLGSIDLSDIQVPGGRPSAPATQGTGATAPSSSVR